MSATPSEGNDLPTKYQKLASEYSKVSVSIKISHNTYTHRALQSNYSINSIVNLFFSIDKSTSGRIKTSGCRRTEQKRGCPGTTTTERCQCSTIGTRSRQFRISK